jgi:hypothetical protein
MIEHWVVVATVVLLAMPLAITLYDYMRWKLKIRKLHKLRDRISYDAEKARFYAAIAGMSASGSMYLYVNHELVRVELGGTPCKY